MREALSICRAKLSPEAPDVREALDGLCGVLERENKMVEAQTLREELQASGR